MRTYWRIFKPTCETTAAISRHFPCAQLFENILISGVAKGSGHGV